MRVTTEASKLALIAAKFRSQSTCDYASGLIVEGAKRDIAEGARQMNEPPVRRSRSSPGAGS
jgi:hypothetical protein